jgi:D-tyrosyl-tRNA(Tyr) deacylase
MTRVVAQRVSRASVTIDGAVVGRIGAGLMLLVGIHRDDDEQTVDRVADKVATLRVFQDDEGKMNRSAAEAGGAMLVVSQFTLYGDLRRGRRPSFIEAAGPELGERLYQRFAERLRGHGYHVECGRFGAHMLVDLENDGPVTIVLDSREL